MKHYKLICMSFDGDYQTEHPAFDDIESAWDYSNNLGSKWFFYPFHFIADAPELLEHFKGLRVASVQKIFKLASEKPELQDADAETFAFSLQYTH